MPTSRSGAVASSVMSNTFRDLMKHDVSAIFGDTDFFGIAATLITPGHSNQSIVGSWAIPDEDVEQGATTNDAGGKRITRVRLFTTSIDNVFVVADVTADCSTLSIAGEAWQCIRIVQRGIAKQVVRIRRDEKVTTKRPIARQ